MNVNEELDGHDEFNLTNFCPIHLEFDEIEKCFTRNIFHPSDILLSMRNYIDYVPANIRS